MDDIYRIRDGRIEDVFPSMFSEDFPKSVKANAIDTMARDVAETLSPMPSFSCGAANMVSDAARTRADKRTRIAYGYLKTSQVKAKNITACDHYGSYGARITVIEPDFEKKIPRISFEDPRGAYWERDRWGRVVTYARIFTKTRAELCTMYPDLRSRLADKTRDENSQDKVEVVHWRDDHQILMFVPECHDLVLHRAPNMLGECPVDIAGRPGVTDDSRGQYDDVMWIQVAANRFAMLAMEAAEQAVEAPLALPLDVTEVAIGPYAGIRSNSPEKIKKIAQEIPQAALAEGQVLDAELKAGARYPGVRTGNLDASIITGQGVQALQGGFDSQIKSGFEVLEVSWVNVLRLCFKMDQAFWPDTEKTLSGEKDGIPYDLKYTPSKDIHGDYSIEVRYGMVAGLDPNRALVFLLQVLGGGLLSKDTIRRELPFDLDFTREDQRIEVEMMREALLQSMAGYAQSVPMMAQAGQDPAEPLRRLALIIQGRAKGKALEDVIAEAFAPPEPTPEELAAQEQQAQDPMAALMGGGGPPGMGGGGPLPEGVAPGQAQMGPGGQPDLMTMLAGLNSGGGPTLNTNVKRAIPA